MTADVLSQELLVAVRTGGDAAPFIEQLRAVDPGELEGDGARIAFWVNVYNARVASAVRERGMRGNLRKYRGFFRDVGWEVGGRVISLHEMEHGVLRANRRAPWTIFRPLSARDPRLAWAVSRLDPRVHFALNCGARSCPPIRAWQAERVGEQLSLATRAYFEGEVTIEGDTLRLPYLCSLFRADFPDLLGFVAEHLDEERAAWVRAHPDAKVRWGEYVWEIAE